MTCKSTTIGTGLPCPKCNKEMFRKKAEITVDRLRQPYFFSEWDYCVPCKHVQHYEKYKVNFSEAMFKEALVKENKNRLL